MMYAEINVVCLEFHLKKVDRLCGQKVESLSATSGDKHSNYWALNG
jgi:hypothetical protein